MQNVKIDSAASIGGQRKYMMLRFPWLPMVATLSVSKRIASTEVTHSLTNITILSTTKEEYIEINHGIVNTVM